MFPFREGIKEFSDNLDLVKLGLKLPPTVLLIEESGTFADYDCVTS